MLVARRFLGAEAIADAGSRTSFGSLILDYGVDARTRRYRINAGSPLIGQRLADAEFGGGAMVGVLVLERTRLWRKTVRTSDGDTILTEGDIVVVDLEVPSAERRRLRVQELALTPDFFESYSRQVGMAEVMIAPDSSARGLSVRSIRFREKHDLVVLGVRHRREAAGPAFPVIRLAAGDTLLVAGGWDSIHRLQAQRQDFIMLDLPAEVKEVAPAANQAPFAIGAVLVMVALMMTGIVPNVIAALIACLLMGLFRCVNMPSAYRSIHWPTILLIVGMLPFALALQRTGGVDLVVDGLLGGLGDANPTILLGGVFVLTAVIGLFVSNTATAVLMGPIAIGIATQLGVSPYPFAMVVALAASAAFMTPVSSPVNTLVVEPGRYSFLDFFKVGAPFTIVVLLVSVFMVPLVLPF